MGKKSLLRTEIPLIDRFIHFGKKLFVDMVHPARLKTKT
jgi:hypothetical protein